MGAGRRVARGVLQRALARAEEVNKRIRDIHDGDPMARRFGSFGAGSCLEHPLRFVTNPQSIVIGPRVHIYPGVILEAVDPTRPVIRVSAGSLIGRDVRLVALNGIEIHEDVAIGHGSNVTDTLHDYKNTRPGDVHWRAPLKLGRPLVIERGVWVGNCVAIHGGLTIGEGAIINALSVVSRDVPPYTIVSGNPARAIRRRNDAGRWEWLVDPRTLDVDGDGAPVVG